MLLLCSYLSLIVFGLFIFIQFCEILTFEEIPEIMEPKHRERRQLLFPNSTVLQLNIGVATAAPLQHVFVNWAIQANFQLPWNRSQVPVDVLYSNSAYDGEARKFKRDIDGYKDLRNESKKHFDNNVYLTEHDIEKSNKYESYSKLHHLYTFLEDTLDGFGHNGSSCVRQVLCQVAAEPFLPRHEDDFLFDIAQLILNPTNDQERDDESGDIEAIQYIQAHESGKKSVDCLEKYFDCPFPLLDLFSALY